MGVSSCPRDFHGEESWHKPVFRGFALNGLILDTDENNRPQLSLLLRIGFEEPRRILAVELAELLVEGRMPLLKLAGPFEEKLGGNSEELGGIGGAIFVEQGFFAFDDLPLETTEFAAKDARPREVMAAMFKQRRAFAAAIFLVELMGELVEDHIVTIQRIGSALDHFVPGQDDRAGMPGFAGALGGNVVNDFTVLLLVLDQIGFGIDEYGLKFRIVAGFAAQQQQAGLRSDGDADFVCDFETGAAFEVLLGQENLHVAEQLVLILLVQPGKEREILFENGEPTRRRSRAPKPRAPAFSEEGEHSAVKKLSLKR
jgi:hypothetical protein